MSPQLRGRLARAGALATLMLAYLALAPSSLLHSDLARDLRVAEGILAGDTLPALGPVLAGRFHLGPGWYYLLAALLVAGGGWSGGAVLLGSLASMQFPLAYLAGKAWAGRRAGLIWSALLILPSWSLFELIFPTHTLLTAPLVLASLLASGKFHASRKGRHLILGGISFSLAIHAHPSALVLAPLLLIQLAHGIYHRHISPFSLALASLVFVLPFSPMLFREIFADGTLLARVGAYYSDLRPTGTSAAGAASLVWQVLGGGAAYWVALNEALPSVGGWLLVFANSGLLLLGIAAVVWGVRLRDNVSGAALLTLAASFLVLVQIRELYPYYLTTTFRVLLLGTAAYGLARLSIPSLLPRLRPAAVWAVCLAVYVPIATFAGRAERVGAWPFAFLPLLDVVRHEDPPRSLALQTARGISKSARWFCRSGPLAMHGPYAAALMLNFGREVASCAAGNLVLGGQEPERKHWIGLPRAQWQHLAPSLVSERLGAFELVPAKRIYSPANSGVNPLVADYPPVPYDRSPPEKELLADIPMNPGETLVLTHLGFPFVLDPIVLVSSSGVTLAPATTDSVSWIYLAPRDQPTIVRLSVRATDPRLIDLAVF